MRERSEVKALIIYVAIMTIDDGERGDDDEYRGR